MLLIQVFIIAPLMLKAVGSADISADSDLEVEDATCLETEEFLALQMQTKVGAAVYSSRNQRQQSAQHGAYGDLYGSLLSHLNELKVALNSQTPSEQLRALNRTLVGVSDLFTGMNVLAMGAVGNASLISFIETSIEPVTSAMKWIDSENANRVAEWSASLKAELERVKSKVSEFPGQVRALYRDFEVRLDATFARIRALLPAAPSADAGTDLLRVAKIRLEGIWEWIDNELGVAREGNGDIKDKLGTLIQDLNATVPRVLHYVKTTLNELWENFDMTITASIEAVKLVVPQSTAIQLQAVVDPVVQRLQNTLHTAMLQLQDAFSDINIKVNILARFVNSFTFTPVH